MKALYVEPFAGISGNMLLGALMDTGVPFAYLENELVKLHLGIYELIDRKVNKSGIDARYFNVITEEGMAHEHEHSRGHEHDHIHDHGHEHVHEQTHDHDHAHPHRMARSRLFKLGQSPGRAPARGKDHGTGHTHVHRNLRDLEGILCASELDRDVIEKAKAVFRAIAAAEAKVHGKTVEEIHFHEVGAIDTMIDVVGNILALQYLEVEKVFTAPVNTGFGFVECAHGMMPVPAPATAELLRGLPHYRGPVDKEMTTPTGAALLRVLAEPVSEVPPGFRGNVIGYGAGTREVSIPNVLRVTLGVYEPEKMATAGRTGGRIAASLTGEAEGNAAETEQNGAHCETLTVMECNLDNMNPELLPPVIDTLLAAGALDAWMQPVIMKKGRPATLLSVLCRRDDEAALQEILFTETTTLGIRSYQVVRHALERRWQQVQTPWGGIRIKEGMLHGRVVNGVPEFEDCRQLAKACGQPLKVIETAALQAWRR